MINLSRAKIDGWLDGFSGADDDSCCQYKNQHMRDAYVAGRAKGYAARLKAISDTAARAEACPSTHCNRSDECRSPHECSSRKKNWGDVFWQWIRAGHDRSSAAYQADLWEKRSAK